MLIHNFDELERRKDELKGKIVFYNYPFNPLFVETFLAYADAVRYRGTGASRAAKYGALAVLVRSMSSSVDNNPHTGALSYNDSFPKIPAAAVGLRDADRLATALESGAGACTVFPCAQVRTCCPTLVAHNVIGELKGSEFPDQYITVGGHPRLLGSRRRGAGRWRRSGPVHRSAPGAEGDRLQAPSYDTRRAVRQMKRTAAAAAGNMPVRQRRTTKKHLLGLESDNGGFTPRAFTLSLPEEKLAAIRPWISLLQPYGVIRAGAWRRGDRMSTRWDHSWGRR